MNQSSASSAPGASLIPNGTGTITTLVFIFIALFAIAAVAIIVIGIVRRRRRAEGARELARNAVASGVPAPGDEPAEVRTSEPTNEPPAKTVEALPAQSQSELTEAEPTTGLEPEPEPEPAPVPVATLPDTGATTTAPETVTHSPPANGPAAAPVTMLKGLGPKVAARLAELGISTVGQIAALTDREAEALDVQLGNFTGRMTRDRWIEQARFLAAGDKAGFESVFGKL